MPAEHAFGSNGHGPAVNGHAPTANGQVSATNGHAPPTNGHTPPVQMSSYLQYLPTPYQDDGFMGRFLLIFESILSPIEQTIDGVASYFDPRLAPADWLPWLASWMGIELDENWPLERRRQLIARGAELLRIQGTRRALREHIELYAGQPPLIVENFSGLRLGQDGLMGVNARLGEPQPHSIDVTVIAERVLDERVLRGIIETHKPAHVGYTLQISAAADLRPDSPPSLLSDDIQNGSALDEPDETPTAVPSGGGL